MADARRGGPGAGAGGPVTGPSIFAFHYRDFRLFFFGRLLATFAVQIVAVSVGWQIYETTRDPFDLGLVGLVQFAPAFLLVLWTGVVADRFSRRLIMIVCLVVEAIAAFGLLLIAADGMRTLWPVYAFLALLGVARAFFAPASHAILPNILPRAAVPNGVAIASSTWQLATIAGPVVGGLLFGVLPMAAYATAVGLLLIAPMLIAGIAKAPRRTRPPAAGGWDDVLAGIRYVLSQRVILGAISLDLFAVLLGGATALLPAVALDLLEVGPLGLGFLRAAPGIGACLVAAYISIRPIRDHAGALMFVFVALFGAATAAFGFSGSTWLSVGLLVIVGAADMVSVTVRGTILQLWTPDEVRGRVNAVNSVFVGASNELGEFRAGTMGAWIGVAPAIIVGGIGTVAVAGIWAVLFPELRKIRRLDRS